MELQNIPDEAFDMPEFRAAILKVQDYLEVPVNKANNIDRETWLEIFTLVPLGLIVFDARLFSPELLWNDVKDMDVPTDWPGSTVVEDEVERPKKMWEYTRVVRSLTDPTKCMLKYSRFTFIPTYQDQQTVAAPYGYLQIDHDLLKDFYQEFGGFSTHDEAQAWKDANVPAE